MRSAAVEVMLARRHFIVLLALLALVAAGCQTSPTAPASSTVEGGVVAQPVRVDLGHVPFNQLAHARFTLTNAGTTGVHLGANVQVQTLEGC